MLSVIRAKLNKAEIPCFASDNRGAAMIVVTCVMMIVSVLCLTMVAAAYQMYATANDEGRDEMYYRQVMSFSEVLKEELTEEYSDPDNPRPDSGLTGYIFEFWDGTVGEGSDTLLLSGESDENELCDITIMLDKAEARGSLVITVSCMDGNEVVATCKFKLKENGGNFEFCEYY